MEENGVDTSPPSFPLGNCYWCKHALQPLDALRNTVLHVSWEIDQTTGEYGRAMIGTWKVFFTPRHLSQRRAANPRPYMRRINAVY